MNASGSRLMCVPVPSLSVPCAKINFRRETKEAVARDPIFDSLRRWTKEDVPQTQLPVSAPATFLRVTIRA
jgi:hypothetical protein